MGQLPSVYDLGFDKNLNRGDSFGGGNVMLPDGGLDIGNGGGSANTELKGGSANGTANLIEDQKQPSELASGEIAEHIVVAADGLIRGGATDYLDGDGFWLGSYQGNPNDYRFFIGDSTGNYLTYANGVLTIVGSVVADSGIVGGWTIGASTITGGSVVLDSTGNIRFGKTSFADTANAGLIMGLNGATPTFYMGTALDASYVKLIGGVYEMVGTISGRSTLTVAAAINSSGNLITDVINARLDSSAKQMLAGFTFGTADYAGALNAGNITWNTTTGVITGGSGVLVYRGGIIGVTSGVATFSIDAATGAATFAGALSAPTGTIGGFTLGATTLSATSAGNTTTLSSGATAFSAGPTATPSVTITQAGVLTATGLVATGSISLAQPFTAGWDMTQGEVAAIESDGKTYPPRYTANASRTSASVNASSTSASRGGSCIVGHRETATSFTCDALTITIFGGNAVYISSIVTNDPVAFASITTSTVAEATTATVCPVLTTTALVGYLTGTTATGIVLSNVGVGAIAVNGATTISTNANYPTVSRYSDTIVAAFYIDTGTGNLNARVLTVGATSFTAGSAQTVLATIGSVIWDIRRFGSSDYYLVTFQDTSNNQKVMCVQFDGATFTGGTPVTRIATTVSRYLNADCLDSTKAIVLDNASLAINAVVYSRSGTTLTAGSPVAFWSDAKNDNGAALGVVGLGSDTFAYAYMTSSANTVNLVLAGVTGTVPSTIGAVKAVTSVANPGTLNTILHCLKVNPKYYCFSYQDNMGNNMMVFEAYAPPSTFAQTIGIVADTAATGVAGGVVMQGFSDDVTGLTTAAPYYVDVDGALITRAQGGLQRFGIALSATTLKVE